MFRTKVKPTRINVVKKNSSESLRNLETTPTKNVIQDDSLALRNLSTSDARHEHSDGFHPPRNSKVSAEDTAATSERILRRKDYYVLLVFMVLLLCFCTANVILTLYLNSSCNCRHSSKTKGNLTTNDVNNVVVTLNELEKEVVEMKRTTQSLTSIQKGESGPRGPAGPPGLPGPPGNLGPRGPPGLQGITSSLGSKGSLGEKGSIGPSGPSGLIGIQGPPGYNGSQGIPGPPGAPGSDRTPGDAGPPGSPGPKGDIGTGNLTLCQHHETVATTHAAGPTAESKIILREDKHPGWKVTGVTCTTIFGEKAEFSSDVDPRTAVTVYTCHCKGTSRLFNIGGGNGIKCVIHYWICPIIT